MLLWHPEEMKDFGEAVEEADFTQMKICPEKKRGRAKTPGTDGMQSGVLLAMFPRSKSLLLIWQFV